MWLLAFDRLDQNMGEPESTSVGKGTGEVDDGRVGSMAVV